MDSTDESSASSSCPSAAPSGPSPKLPSSQYKGVVPQPNGRWGAQIYEKHQRVWLGTFNLERDAARAYDAAAQRFRGRDAATNFPPLPPSSPELSFLLSRSKSEVVDMLRKHTYLDELHHHRRLLPLSSPSPSLSLPRDHLFDKAVTPSDVGKLNRLVIPKQHAERHFPLAAPDAAGAGLLLAFEDPAGKLWRFRYSYWNSSQSYVLTKGWSRFVKEKGLKPGDSVGFYRARQPGGQLYIDCRVRPAAEPAKPVRIFGVDLVNAGDSDGKRRLDTPLPQQIGWFKKQCVVGV